MTKLPLIKALITREGKNTLKLSYTIFADGGNIHILKFDVDSILEGDGFAHSIDLENICNIFATRRK